MLLIDNISLAGRILLMDSLSTSGIPLKDKASSAGRILLRDSLSTSIIFLIANTSSAGSIDEIIEMVKNPFADSKDIFLLPENQILVRSGMQLVQCGIKLACIQCP